jgi:hypothetical protein
MILYIASYPRCGNSLTRDIIQTYFKRPASSVHPWTNPIPVRLPHATNWRLPADIPLAEKLRHPWLIWNDQLALYDQTVSPHAKNQRFLMRGCGVALTSLNRLRLATEKTVYVLKTHYRPYKRYFPGEAVLQIVRHPGPVIKSYYNLHKKDGIERHTLDDFIAGKVEFGSWNDYHTEWMTAAQRLGQRYARIRFEQVRDDPMQVCQPVKAFTGWDFDPAAQTRDFEQRQAANPVMFSTGSNADWEAFFTPEQRQQIAAVNQPMMQYLEYA